MTTTITGDGIETDETDTDTMTGGITDGQLVRGLLDRGLSLGDNGEVVVENAQQLEGQNVMDLLGHYSFAGRSMSGNGGRVMNTNTDASGDPTGIQINPGQDFPEGTNFSGEVTQNGSAHIGEPGGSFAPPMRHLAAEQLPATSLLYQMQSFDNTPIFSVENGAAARTSLFNGTLAVGSDRRAGEQRSGVGTTVALGDKGMELRGDVNGGIVAQDENGNTNIIV